MLLEALNSRFPTGSGATKRRGHVATVARNTTPIPPNESPPAFDPPAEHTLYSASDRSLPTDWLFGWGAIYDNRRDATVAVGTSEHPDAGLLFGAALRDSEAVVWNGHQFLSRSPGQAAGEPLPTTESAVFPMARVEPIAKAAGSAQNRVQVADTGRIRVAAWYNEDTDEVEYSVVDSITGTSIVAPTVVDPAFSDVEHIRIVPVGQWVHILVSDSSLLLRRCSIHADSPRDVSTTSLGVCDTHFDYDKVSDTDWVVLRNGGADDLYVTWHYANGAVNAQTHESSTPSMGDVEGIGAVSIAVHPASGNFCIAVRGELDQDGAGEGGLIHGIYSRVYLPDGTAGVSVVTTVVDTASADNGRQITVAPKYLYNVDGYDLFDIYYDTDTGSGNTIGVARVHNEDVVDYTEVRYHFLLASKAFRVGDRTFCWAGYRTPFQSSWVLLDETLRPVGKCNYITANVPADGDHHHLFSVNFSGDAPRKDRVVHHSALSYRIRVASEAPSLGENTPAVFADPSIEIVTLDFLPPLRTAQAGRALYVAGAQQWSYDGAELTEAGFHFGPENVTAVLAGSGGGLSVGAYRWRVDLCYRNAQNEEIRSNSFFTDEYSPTSGQKATLTIPTVPTRRDNSYFLIFRNEINGTQWYLVSSRDPASALFLRNDWNDGTASVSFLDDGLSTPTDAELIAAEPHPGNAGPGYLQPVGAAAHEVIAAGHDRVWIAGGEIGPGQVHPSRLYTPGEAPSFNPLLVVQVDRAAEPITAIGFIGEMRAYFRSTQSYVHEGDGPDNSSNGVWLPPRLAYADVGAVGPESLALISAGLLFQSPAGIRLMGPGGALTPIGRPVDSLAADLSIAGALVVGPDQEVRFYARSGQSLVYNYHYDTWTTWSVTAAGVTRNPDTGLAVLAAHRGYLWDETEGVWTDAGSPYNHRIRFSWLRRGDLMDFQRVRRIGGLGTWDPEQPHKVHVDVYYDEREFAEEWFDWDMPDPGSANTTEFGDGSFGDGAFGDTD